MTDVSRETPPSLFDDPLARRHIPPGEVVAAPDPREAAVAARAAALAAVEEHASEEWKERAWVVLDRYLRSHPEFFVDEFWACTGLDAPRESRALGPLVLRASRSGMMRKSGRSRPSVRSHMSDKPVWHSLVWQLDGACRSEVHSS